MSTPLPISVVIVARNEARNLDNNQLFVSKTPDPPGAAGGEFDDQMVWITAGELYSKLIAAGRLP